MTNFNVYELEINNRAFKAIKEQSKKVEIRVTKIGDSFDYGVIKANDIINFTSYDQEKISCKVNKINWYKTIEELLTVEGTEYTLSSTNDFNEGVKSINSFPGYPEGIKQNGVYAIHIETINN
jgi:ASC-1-like (ASCH) protein